ncbi:hypothetical protein HMPREF9065_01067 [Aggregatibacter sp. oral taxon 458 str. W10330]|jgi:hypothetical protein|uniref:hypothetical protein n=1 Tax=Aggregatibacter sp. oral taxon 458 TaxID=712148 RepID=UPI0003986ED9|nr:hypothetical protein [Aggregatibacter sp. oral taxon 458]ERH27748.1 hypothetical protein HMPREF9065_01067 [Aggregatibacter sp. oral taxon 458 str. W10330]
MENLSKLIINNELCFRNINFNGFSTSNKWVGYFKAKDLSDVGNIKRASELLKTFFCKDLDNFFLLSALVYDDDSDIDDGIRESEYLEEYLFLYEEAKKSNFLNDYDGVYKEYFESIDLKDEKQPPISIFNMHFDLNKIFLYCELVLAFYFGKISGGICFLINPKLGIALYPHDDIGYGCISLTEDTSLSEMFLNFCNKDQYFSSIFNEELIK